MPMSPEGMNSQAGLQAAIGGQEGPTSQELYDAAMDSVRRESAARAAAHTEQLDRPESDDLIDGVPEELKPEQTIELQEKTAAPELIDGVPGNK